MIDRGHELPLTRQAELLRLSRGSLYYQPRPVPAADLAIMRRIDELHLDYPFAGSRMLRDLLRGEGIAIGRELVATMMRRMGIEALYRRPNTSKPADGHKIYPYLLRGLAVERPNQVWAMDITYIPMARGFVYLAAVVDWFSRRVLAWRVSITLEVEFCLEAVEEALARYGQAGDFQHRPGQPVHQRRIHRPAVGQRDRDQHGRPRRVARQRVCRAAVAVGEIRGGLSACLRQCRPRHVLRSGGIWTSTTASGRIRALMRERRTAPTSTTCRWSRQHEFRRRCRGITPVGLRPPCVTPRQRHTTPSTGRGSTYRRRNAVSTKPATSHVYLGLEMSHRRISFSLQPQIVR